MANMMFNDEYILRCRNLRKARRLFDPVSHSNVKVSKSSRRENVISNSRECKCTFPKSYELIYKHEEVREKIVS